VAAAAAASPAYFFIFLRSPEKLFPDAWQEKTILAVLDPSAMEKKKDDSCVTRVGWLQQCQPP
jgi:hypothetical protein